MIFNLIGYFLAIVLLVYIYVVFLTFLAKTLFFIIKESKQWILQKLKKTKEDKTRETFVLDEYLPIIKNNPFFLKTKENKIILVAVFIGNIIFWQYFRYKPENNQFEHKEAREYYALSHMLLSYNMGLLVIFRNPDSIVLKPLNLLQDSLIDSAKKHLPKDDGEIAMFNYHFKLYPYVATHYDPAPSEAKKISALTYKVLKEFSTLEIKDKEVREYSRYRLYPMAAEYFIFIQWNEYGHKSGEHRSYMEKVYTSLYKDPLKLKQLEDIGRWSLMHYKELKNYPKIDKFIKENPLIDAMYLADITLPLLGVLEAKIFHLTFRCEDELMPIVHKYIDIFSKRYHGKGDKRFRGYNNAIITQSAPFSDVSCALCEYEPMEGTYMFKEDTCYPVHDVRGIIPEYKNSDPLTHFKWSYRVASLEKIILKTNTREQVLKCYDRDWEHYRANINKQPQEIKNKFAECLVENSLITDKDRYLQKCYNDEWMGLVRISKKIKDRKEQVIYLKNIQNEYEECLVENSLINLEKKD